MTRAAPLWRPIGLAAAAAFAIALLGASMTDVGPWYQSLRVPAWKPPDWAFGPAWTAIFACAAASAVTLWRAAPDRSARDTTIALFMTNGFFNVLWSVLFFNLKRPDWALIETIPFLASIVVIIAYAWPRSRAAASWMAPYLVWVCFATALNAAIVRLNAPFG